MTLLELARLRSDRTEALTAGIFDVDGVLLASPHERAWREALKGFADPGRFTTAMNEAHVAGKPRLSGARAALQDIAHQLVIRRQMRLGIAMK
jgi:beta-phosphoglucomutase